MPAKSRGRPHHAVLELGAHLVAVAVERRQAVAGKLGGFLQDGVDRVVGGMLVARQRRDLLQSCHFAQRETHIGEWGGIGHLLSSGPQYAALGRFWRPAQVFSTIMSDTVLLAIDGPRATITLNDPAKHNRLDPEGLDLLMAAVETADANPDVRVTVITGAGEKTFCSGYDLGSIPASGQKPEAHGTATRTRPSRTSWTASRPCACRRCAR